MAVTRSADIGNHIPELWGADLYAQAENMTFWNRFQGPEGSTMPIIRKDDLEQDAGDTVKVDLVLALTGAGLTGDTSGSLLEGNEEALKFRQMSVVVDSLQHAVRWTKLGKILINHDMRTTALNQLRKWLAGKFDDAIFTELTGAGTAMPAGNIWAAGDATTRNTIDAADVITLDEISNLKAYAQTELLIEPLRLEDGEEVFGLALHPYAALSLKKTAEWKQAQREARERGALNPLFTGAVGMYDGVVLYTSNRVPRSNNAAGTPVPVANNVFFGAQALSRAYAYYPDWTEEYFSYGQEQGIATWTVLGNKLNVFDLSAAGDASGNRAIGSMVVYASAPAPGQP